MPMTSGPGSAWLRAGPTDRGEMTSKRNILAWSPIKTCRNPRRCTTATLRWKRSRRSWRSAIKSRRQPPEPPPSHLMANGNGTCLVVMGFGKKTDFESGKSYDLDKAYQNMIKPAVEAAGLKCIRADEIVHSGLIDVPMYDQLLNADVVVADVSTSNRNALYELGVRHALRPYTTVIIAEETMMKSPTFDLSHIVIRQYRHLGEDIGVSEAKRFTTALTAAIQEIMSTEPELRGDSPVYKFIERLTPPSIPPAVRAAIAAASSTEKVAGAATPAHSELMQRVDEAQKKGDWVKAKMLLEEIREMRRAGTL